MTSQLEQLLAWKKAESLRKNGQTAEALEFFVSHYGRTPSADAGWRVIWCLRHLGRLEEAEKSVGEMSAAFPDDAMIRSEAVWMIYERVVKPARQAKDNLALLEGARRMLDSGAEGLARQQAVFAGIQAAKALGVWDEVLALCDRLAPEKLQKNPRLLQGRRLPSELEQWYFARVKALLSLKQFPDAREMALKAVKDFPGRIDFARWAAIALEGMDQRAEAIVEMERLTARGRVPWFIFADLARMRIADEDIDGAWNAACRAAEIPGGELTARVNLFTLLARIAEVRGEMETAGLHALLSAALRESQGWRLPDDLADLLTRLPIPDSAPEIGPLEKLCRERRGGLSNPAGEAGGQACGAPQNSSPGSDGSPTPEILAEGVEGTVLMKFPEAPFAFIKSAVFADPVFVTVKDLPQISRQDGAVVRFTAVRSFDRKKNREGVRATAVSPKVAAA